MQPTVHMTRERGDVTTGGHPVNNQYNNKTEPRDRDPSNIIAN